MKSFPQSIAESRHLLADLLVTDLELALTFLETARISHVEETVLRNQRNARKAYDFAERALANRSFDVADRDLVQRKLIYLQQELKRVGQTF